MLGYVVMALFLCAGLATADGVFRRQDGLVRVWLGLCAGLMMMMWLPTLLAFFLRFTVTAQWGALALSWLIALAAQLSARGKSRQARLTDMPPWLLPALAGPPPGQDLILVKIRILALCKGGISSHREDPKMRGLPFPHHRHIRIYRICISCYRSSSPKMDCLSQ